MKIRVSPATAVLAALSLSLAPAAIPAPLASAQGFVLGCGDSQDAPLVDPYCLTSDFLGLTEGEILDEISLRWEGVYNAWTNCEEEGCSLPGACVPAADFLYGDVTITFISQPANFEVCFEGASLNVMCTPCAH